MSYRKNAQVVLIKVLPVVDLCKKSAKLFFLWAVEHGATHKQKRRESEPNYEITNVYHILCLYNTWYEKNPCVFMEVSKCSPKFVMCTYME